jgi:tetratricopeptide (TPR) repeat protein
MSPVTASFTPGDRYFDHFDLTGLENPDFYPDGRDLGENYTYTLWLTSPCVRRGQLDCLHCHTSSGRYRFKDADANNACMPCHEQRVRNADVHTRHKPDSPGNRCVTCHMPMTEFARMRRTDHSMHPPTPAATITFKSPNACNLCHADQDAAWADQIVRKWYSRDYQAPVLQRAGLVDAARKRDWSRLPDMLAILTGADRDEVYAASLVRLLRGCDDSRKWPVLIKLLSDPSPLVRSSAAEALVGQLAPETVAALIGSTRDDYRLVRVRAAAALAALPRESLGERDRNSLEAATAEFEAAMHARPDDFASYYNLGNFFMERRDLPQAVKCFEMSSRLRPDHVAPLVNASLAYNELGQNEKAEESLRRALKIEPASAAANLNLGLLLAEMGRPREAEDSLRAAFKADPKLAVAAYNLGVLLAGDRLDEAIDWCRKAAELQGDEPKYAYTLAFYLHRKGDTSGALRVLQPLVDRGTAAADVYALLGQIYTEDGQKDKAIGVYRQAMANERLPDQDRARFAAMIESLSSP